MKNQSTLFSFSEMYPEALNYGLKLTVNNTGILEMD